jgi:hypothetical protein
MHIDAGARQRGSQFGGLGSSQVETAQHLVEFTGWTRPLSRRGTASVNA